MIKTLYTLIFCIALIAGHAQQEDAIADIKKFQAELNAEYKDAEKSPLDPKDRKKFKRHDFFDIDLKYRVVAKLNRNVSAEILQMKTSTARVARYKRYALATFQFDGQEYTLTLYQSIDLMSTLEYEDYLFLPLLDKTSGVETYGAGRYIDLRIPDGDEIIIDFNKAYNPYCAYSTRYSCPRVPDENNLDFAIRAGIRYSGKHK